jgi:hypothetical protein
MSTYKKKKENETKDYRNYYQECERINQIRGRILSIKSDYLDYAKELWSELNENEKEDIRYQVKVNSIIQTDSLLLSLYYTECLKQFYKEKESILNLIDFLFSYKFEFLSQSDIDKFDELMQR